MIAPNSAQYMDGNTDVYPEAAKRRVCVRLCASMCVCVFVFLSVYLSVCARSSLFL